MHKRYNRSKIKRKKRSLKSTNAGPILQLLATIAAILGVITLAVFVIVPYVLPMVGINFTAPWEPTPTPTPTPRPTPTPNPITSIDPLAIQNEVVLTGQEGYQWFADPYAYGSTLMFTAGKLVDGSVKMDAMIKMNMETGEFVRLNPKLANYCYVYPMCNAEWLVYFDSKQNGGGMLRALNLETGDSKEIKEVFAGQPRPILDGNIVAWMERTGSRMDKIFVCDINSLETAVVRTFSGSAYGQSGISMRNGELVYAYDGTSEQGVDNKDVSDINRVNIAEGKTTTYVSSTYAHDPLTNGLQWIWRDGLHGLEDSLYWAQGDRPQTLIDENIVDYGISDGFCVYSKDEELWVYLFDTREKTRMTPSSEKAQLLGVSNGTVIWMDVTSREREVMKYARLIKD